MSIDPAQPGFFGCCHHSCSLSLNPGPLEGVHKGAGLGSLKERLGPGQKGVTVDTCWRDLVGPPYVMVPTQILVVRSARLNGDVNSKPLGPIFRRLEIISYILSMGLSSVMTATEHLTFIRTIICANLSPFTFTKPAMPRLNTIPRLEPTNAQHLKLRSIVEWLMMRLWGGHQVG